MGTNRCAGNAQIHWPNRMGLVKVPKLSHYWSTSELYSFTFTRNTMPRNPFELLLKFWHFSNNQEELPEANRLHKCERVPNMFIEPIHQDRQFASTNWWSLGDRLRFRQCFPSKRHRYGIKLYKLCTGKKYTWNLSKYISKDSTDGEYSASENVVFKLIQNLLNEGRTIYMDNYYMSTPLAYRLFSWTLM